MAKELVRVCLALAKMGTQEQSALRLKDAGGLSEDWAEFGSWNMLDGVVGDDRCEGLTADRKAPHVSLAHREAIPGTTGSQHARREIQPDHLCTVVTQVGTCRTRSATEVKNGPALRAPSGQIEHVAVQGELREVVTKCNLVVLGNNVVCPLNPLP